MKPLLGRARAAGVASLGALARAGVCQAQLVADDPAGSAARRVTLIFTVVKA